MSGTATELDDQGRARAWELLAALSDLTGDAEALEALRREAASFDAEAAAVSLTLELLAVEREEGP